MVGGTGKLYSFIVPVLLAALTLAVFARLQDYGPESAFRRFYEAALKRDVATIDATTLEGADSPIVGELVRGIRALAERGARPQALGMRLLGNRAMVETVFIDPDNGMRIHVLWVLERRNQIWRLNAEATNFYVSHPLGV